MKNKHWHKYLVFALFCVAIYFPLFLHLDWLPMNNWDESLFGMRAAYMAEEGEYLRDYGRWVEGGMMHRSTKPPFTTWLQVASFKMFGISELALRLPIALCALGTVLLLVWFASQKLGDIRIGYCAGFVLVTSLGFVREHGCRTGDQDAALALYMLAGALAFYCYLDAATRRERHGWLAALTAATIAATMTKYAFGLLFFPAMLVYAIHKRQLWNIVRRGSTWLAALTVALALGGWLWHIERQLPGFVEQAFFHEMANRYTEAYAGHDHPWWYYFERFWRNSYFLPWLLLLPAPLFILFSKKHGDQRLRDASLLAFLCAAILLLAITFSKTKTDHYDMVAYPPMALLAGMGLWQVVLAIRNFWQSAGHRPVVFLAAFLVSIFLVVRPYWMVFDKVYKPVLGHPSNQYGYLLRKIQKTRPGCKNFTVLAPIYTGQVNFYAGLLNRKEGYRIRLSEHPKQVAVGDTIVACESKMIGYLMEHFELQPIETQGKCFLAIAKAEKG